MRWLLKFITDCLSPSSAVSFGRTASALSLCFCLGWDTAYVRFTMKHMDFVHIGPHDILPAAGVLMAQSAFCASFYGINKLKAGVDGVSTGHAPN